MRTAEAPRLDRAGSRRSRFGVVDAAWRRANTWMFTPGDARRLAAVRIGLCALLAARIGRGIYRDLASQPPALFRPVSFMRLLHGMPGRGVVIGLQAAGIAAGILAAVGLRARVALPVAWACALVLNGMATSAGKVVHNDVLLMLALLPLLPAPTSDRWSVDAGLGRRRRGRSTGPSGRYGWPVRGSMAVIAAAYFVIGLNKLILSGPAWVFSSNLRWALYASSDARRVPNGAALFIADRPLLSHVVALVALGLEVGFPLVLWSSRLRPVLVGGMIALHLGIMMTMGLDYMPWIVTDVVVFLDWPRWVDALKGRFSTAASRAAAEAP